MVNLRLEVRSSSLSPPNRTIKNEFEPEGVAEGGSTPA